jgi:chemotaxis protein CheD
VSVEYLARNRYWDPHLKQQAAKLLPGEYYATEEDMVLVTVLGSCVAACIRDASSGVGGMNHFMLPENSEDANGLVTPSARYGTHAMEMLINRLVKLGVRRANLEAKVFGGGNVIQGMTETRIGERNARFVHEFLGREGIRVVAEDLLGDLPRKVYFFPRTGRVLVKRLRILHNDTVAVREAEYRQRLRAEKIEGDVELFT